MKLGAIDSAEPYSDLLPIAVDRERIPSVTLVTGPE
jgi:hypothetical protein